MSYFDEIQLRMNIRSTPLTREMLDCLEDVVSVGGSTTKKRIRVWRNFNFESIAKTVKILLRESRIEVEWVFSGYDDSLSYTLEFEGEFDLEVVWADLSRFKGSQIEKKNWLQSQVKNLMLQSGSTKFMVFSIGVDEQITSFIHHKIEESLSPTHLNDARMYSLFGTQLSDKGQLIYSKFLGLQLLPSYFGKLKKIIAVDLDETLHKGILGEDGPEGIQVTEKHLEFQTYLLTLKKHGFILVLVTKNHIDDVRNLINSERYTLSESDFIRVYAGWEPKYEYINQALVELNLSVESLVFIDDNIGELFSFSHRFPEADFVKAEADAGITRMRLLYTPGMFQLNKDTMGERRYDDIKANIGRQVLSETQSDKRSYFVALKPQLEFIQGSKVDLDRFAVQSYRTNQFNLNLTKYDTKSLEVMHFSKDFFLFQIAYSDSFGESGIIGSSVVKLGENQLRVCDLFISCRTLGRGIEFEILEEYFYFLSLEFSEIDSFEIAWTRGGRNQPSFRWLEMKSNNILKGERGQVTLKCDKFERTNLFEVKRK